MDKLDSILLEAWNRISAKVRKKRISALKRSRRRFKGVLTRPMREWCLVIRASDTRINDHSATTSKIDAEAWREQRPHTITLSGKLIRTLTKPIMIPWPGVTYGEAADICGREHTTMKAWVHSGQFRIDHYREFRYPEFSKRRLRGVSDPSRSGRPYVWTPSPIDPNNFQGRVPHPVWGTMWQWLWQELPEDYHLMVRREPEFRQRMRDPAPAFRGWSFICPGRLASTNEFTTENTENTEETERGQKSEVGGQPNLSSVSSVVKYQHVPCGRRCRYLYGPQTVWTLAKALGEEMTGGGFAMPEDCGLPRLAGEWFPGEGDPIQSKGLRSFACKECWSVRSACMANAGGWNEFIAQISGGLLYGRDVPRPLDICPMQRKRRISARKQARLAHEAALREAPATLAAQSASA